MPATYDKAGLTFQYPDNWEVADDTDDMPRTISIQSPSGAFWSVDLHPFSVDTDYLLEQMLAAMQAEYEDIEVDRVEDETVGAASLGYDLTFYCLDFLVACQIRCFRHGHAVYVMTYQAEDREFDQLKDVFRAITTSMLSEEAIS
jgi:hypothetical protein